MWIIEKLVKLWRIHYRERLGFFSTDKKKKELLSFFLELGFAVKSKLVAVVVVKQWSGQCHQTIRI